MPAPRLGPRDVGTTVSLRVRTPAGPTDVVGVVLAVGDGTVTLRRRDGRSAEVPLSAVVAGRRVPPGPAAAITVAALEQVSARGWRALETEPLGDWTLRAAGGFTGRANSALVLGDPGRPVDDALAAVTAWYADRGLAPRLQLPDGAQSVAQAAVARGWTTSPEVHAMTAELTHVLRAGDDGAAPADIHVDAAPDHAWLAAYRADEATTETTRAVLVNHPRVAFVSIRSGEECVATARVAVDDRWCGLFAVGVEPSHRRRGFATAVSVAALRWAGQQGARHVYLQVTAGNAAAYATYARLGFAVHHSYRYAVAEPA